MWKLIPIMTFCLVMSWISHKKSVLIANDWGESRYEEKDFLFFAVMAVAMAVFVGLRTSGNDTFTYRSIYEAISGDRSAFDSINWFRLAAAPGLQFVCACLRVAGATTQDYLMLFALVTIGIYLWFIRKYTNHLWLSMYYFLTMGVYTFTMAAIKQTVAVAFLLIATDRAIEKKYVRFAFWVLIAELFHPYAFVYLIVPFLFFSPWTGRTWVLLAATVAAALGLSTFMSSILAMTDALGANYGTGEFIGDGVNIFRVLVVWVPVVISYLGRGNLQRSADRVKNLCINATMINAMIMFIGLFGTANYFARLANYFLIFQTLSLPRMMELFDDRSRRLVVRVSVVCYFAYSYYENVLANGLFDSAYHFMTFFEFLEQLF